MYLTSLSAAETGSLFAFFFLFSFSPFSFVFVCSESLLTLSVLFCCLSFFLSFCSKSTGLLELNYSGLFFLKIANKQIGNFLSARFRELLIYQLDHINEFQHKMSSSASLWNSLFLCWAIQNKLFVRAISRTTLTLWGVIEERAWNHLQQKIPNVLLCELIFYNLSKLPVTTTSLLNKLM